MCGIYRKDS
jgi:hypothetical protein